MNKPGQNPMSWKPDFSRAKVLLEQFLSRASCEIFFFQIFPMELPSEEDTSMSDYARVTATDEHPPKKPSE
jgi:hypothetical protein